MADLLGREIFAVGKWNGIEFSEDDLDDIVANFEKLQEKHKVPLKFGHNDDQPLKDGELALGWVSRVFREGKKLLADFKNVPQIVIDLIKKKQFRTVSVELLFNVNNSGQKFDHVLDAVAILGATQPAVNTLADLDAFLAMRTEFSGGHRISFETVTGEPHRIQTQEIDMDAKELQAAIGDAVKTAVAPLQSALEAANERADKLEGELKAAKDANEKRDKKEAEQKLAASRKAVNEVLDKAVHDKRMTPAAREAYAKSIGVDDDDRVGFIDIEQVKVMCSHTDGDTGNNGTGASSEGDEDLEAADQLIRKTHEFMAKHDQSDFRKAFFSVARANPELHKEYLDSNGEV